MNIAIIGSGSIGLLYAAYLQEKHAVTLFTNRNGQANRLTSEGLTLQAFNDTKNISVKAYPMTSLMENKEFYDLVIVAVKQYHLSEVVPSLRNLPKQTSLLFLQNGMGHLELLHTLENTTIFVGTVSHGAYRLDDTSVSHRGLGSTNIALFKGKKEPVFSKLTMMGASFSFEFKEEYYLLLLEKLVINSVINPLTAIFKITNGELFHNEHFCSIAKSLYEELETVYQNLSVVCPFEQIKEIGKKTGHNRSSMLSDIENGRQTEIDAILGYTLSIAEKQNNRLSLVPLLYKGIKGEELRGRKQSG
ncbi:2-dehydropantoate 2-reductase [Bacillus spongiae]|uniref:2-dehydropantoate 2-reductase n=1 Tax=Bacillus spongiae TaxID=2683610 RepID=A0ABU8H9S0_9BACI